MLATWKTHNAFQVFTDPKFNVIGCVVYIGGSDWLLSQQAPHILKCSPHFVVSSGSHSHRNFKLKASIPCRKGWAVWEWISFLGLGLVPDQGLAQGLGRVHLLAACAWRGLHCLAGEKDRLSGRRSPKLGVDNLEWHMEVNIFSGLLFFIIWNVFSSWWVCGRCIILPYCVPGRSPAAHREVAHRR